MLNRVIYFSVVAFVALFFACGRQQLNPPCVPRIEISEKSWNFGVAQAGNEVRHTFVIKNIGCAELIFYPYPDCPACMFVEVDKYSIPPKGELTMNVRVVETQAGTYNGFINIESNDIDRPTLKLTVKGTFIKQV